MEEGVNHAGTDSAWIRLHFSDSIYLWACGEKADDADDYPKLSDRLIGWLILFMQGFAYTMLIFLERATSNSDTSSSSDDSNDSGYLLPSVTGAMYLLVASTTHDLRAGFSLFVDGTRAGHRAFGFGLLIVYGIMISAAMTVLVSTSDDSASVVLNAVTVLFVADLDEKVLNFLSTVPQKWRLFWALEAIGISFALAVVAIYYIGDSSSLLEGNNAILKTYPPWFVWAVNPAAVTLCSFALSTALQAVCNFCSEACETVDEPPAFGVIVANANAVFKAVMKKAKQRFRREPWFHVALVMWILQALASWGMTVSRDDVFPIAFVFDPPTTERAHASLVLSDNRLILVYSNTVLVIGLAIKAVGIFLTRHQRGGSNPGPPINSSSDASGPRERGGSCADSRAPSVLIGSGIGYWVTSLMYVLGCSWYEGGCGWNNAPIVVSLIGYVVIPCFLVASIFMVADIHFLGTRVGAFVKPAVEILRNRRRVEYWIMAAVFRDFIDLWIGHCSSLESPLSYYL